MAYEDDFLQSRQAIQNLKDDFISEC